MIYLFVILCHIFVSFILQAINGSGCDKIVALGAWYKMQTSQDDSWSYKEAKTANQTRLTIDVLSYKLYDVKVTAINNKNISSTSESVTADLRTSELRIL